MRLRNAICFSVAIGSLVFIAAPEARADEARELVQKTFAAIPGAPFSAKIKLTTDRGLEREMVMYRARQDDVDKIYIEVTAPADLKGTRFLMLDHLKGKDEQWIYSPASKTSVQLDNESRKQEFLGSDFILSDIVRPDLDAFDYKVAGEETLDGRVCSVIESKPKNAAEEAYSKSVIAIDPKDHLIVRGLLFDANSRPSKTLVIDRWEKKDGHWTPTVQRMVNVQNNHWSKIELLDVKYNAVLPKNVFEKSYLTRTQ